MGYLGEFLVALLDMTIVAVTVTVVFVGVVILLIFMSMHPLVAASPPSVSL